jgi:hypothetical protein
LESRTQFTEIYNEIIMLEDTILQFESQLSPEGTYGKRYSPLNSESDADLPKRRRVQQVIEEASMEAEGIITAAKQTIAEMIKILEGVIRKEADGNYDTLVNIMQISSKNPNFVSDIDNSIRRFQQTLQFLDTIDMLALGSQEGGNFLPLAKE